jgi:hypothetical protein
MKLNFMDADGDTVLGFIEWDGHAVTHDGFGREMLNSGWSPDHKTDEDIFQRYAEGFNKASYVRVVHDGGEVSSSSEVPVSDTSNGE